MNKKFKIALATVIVLAAGFTSASVFAASDTTATYDNHTRLEQRTDERLNEYVQQGDLTQEEADDMRQWMNDGRTSCHGNNTNMPMRQMRGQHRQMMGN